MKKENEKLEQDKNTLALEVKTLKTTKKAIERQEDTEMTQIKEQIKEKENKIQELKNKDKEMITRLELQEETIAQLFADWENNIHKEQEEKTTKEEQHEEPPPPKKEKIVVFADSNSKIWYEHLYAKYQWTCFLTFTGIDLKQTLDREEEQHSTAIKKPKLQF